MMEQKVMRESAGNMAGSFALQIGGNYGRRYNGFHDKG